MNINLIKKEPGCKGLFVFLFTFVLFFSSMIYTAYLKSNIQNDLFVKSLKTIELSIQDEQEKLKVNLEENKKDKYLNNLVKINQTDSKHLHYTYNNGDRLSTMLGINVISSLGKSSNIEKIKKITLNGANIDLEDLTSEYKFRKFAREKIIEAENYNDSDLETITIELK